MQGQVFCCCTRRTIFEWPVLFLKPKWVINPPHLPHGGRAWAICWNKSVPIIRLSDAVTCLSQYPQYIDLLFWKYHWKIRQHACPDVCHYRTEKTAKWQILSCKLVTTPLILVRLWQCAMAVSVSRVTCLSPNQESAADNGGAELKWSTKASWTE